MSTRTITVTIEFDEGTSEQEARAMYRAAIEIENVVETQLNTYGWIKSNNIGVKSCRAEYEEH